MLNQSPVKARLKRRILLLCFGWIVEMDVSSSFKIPLSSFYLSLLNFVDATIPRYYIGSGITIPNYKFMCYWKYPISVIHKLERVDSAFWWADMKFLKILNFLAMICRSLCSENGCMCTILINSKCLPPNFHDCTMKFHVFFLFFRSHFYRMVK